MNDLLLPEGQPEQPHVRGAKRDHRCTMSVLTEKVFDPG